MVFDEGRGRIYTHSHVWYAAVSAAKESERRTPLSTLSFRVKASTEREISHLLTTTMVTEDGKGGGAHGRDREIIIHIYVKRE